MNIHEYQAKELFIKYGIPVLSGKLIEFNEFTKSNDKKKFETKLDEELSKAIDSLNSNNLVVKAQIHAGGRGKAGGVKIGHSPEEIKKISKSLLGSTLVTKQTGEKGKEVNKIYLEEPCNILKEYYTACILDREKKMVCFIASTEGGTEIEEVAQNTPEKIIKVYIDPSIGFFPFHARKLIYGLKMDPAIMKQAIYLFTKIYQVFMENSCLIVEINPLVQTKENKLIPLDAKINFDDNSLFRHPEILSLRDLTEEDPTEIEANKHNLSFIKLEGNIGCLVNGAGLAMATMDIIKLHGGLPANFLDVGGGATKESVTEAFKIILKDSNVKAILVNIFGGIMKCDIIAQGIIEATKELELNVPLVVRLEGTNVKLGKSLLEDSNLKIITANDLNDAAQKVVKCIN